MEYAGNLFRAVILLRGAYLRRASLRLEAYREYWGREASAIALLTPLGYIMVLFAMRLAPVSHVAPVREMSMLMGMYFWSRRYLNEGQWRRRLIGSACIAGGVAALAFG